MHPQDFCGPTKRGSESQQRGRVTPRWLHFLFALSATAVLYSRDPALRPGKDNLVVVMQLYYSFLLPLPHSQPFTGDLRASPGVYMNVYRHLEISTANRLPCTIRQGSLQVIIHTRKSGKTGSSHNFDDVTIGEQREK